MKNLLRNMGIAAGILAILVSTAALFGSVTVAVAAGLMAVGMFEAPAMIVGLACALVVGVGYSITVLEAVAS